MPRSLDKKEGTFLSLMGCNLTTIPPYYIRPSRRAFCDMFRRNLTKNFQALDLGINSSVSRSVLLPLRLIARHFPSLNTNLGSILEPDEQALLVQHSDTADKLPASVIVVFFDRPAFLWQRRINFLRASFMGDLWLSTRLQFCLDLHLSPLTQPISILRLIFYNVLR